MNPSTAAMRPAGTLVQDIRPPVQPVPAQQPAMAGPQRPVAHDIVSNIPVRQPGEPVAAGPAPQVIGNPIIDSQAGAVDNELDLILRDVSEQVKGGDQKVPKKGLFSWLKQKAPTAAGSAAAPQPVLAIILACAAAICLIAGSIMTFSQH